MGKRPFGVVSTASGGKTTDFPISAYANKLPRLCKTGSPDADAMLPTYEKTIKQTITKLQAEPHLSLGVWAQLSSGTLAKAVDGKCNDDDLWDDSYTKIWRLPKYFFVAVMIRISDLTQQELDLIDGKDADAIRLLADSWFQLRQSDALPAQLLNKKLCFAVFIERAKQVGDRARGWKGVALSGDGSIDWRAGGSYEFEFRETDGVLLSITHRGSKMKKNVEFDGVTRAWTLHDPCHEMLTELKCGAKRMHIASLFDEGTGPHQFHIADSANIKRVNSFRDLAVARAVSGQLCNEKACESAHGLTVAKSMKADKMKALAKARGTTKRSTSRMSFETT